MPKTITSTTGTAWSSTQQTGHPGDATTVPSTWSRIAWGLKAYRAALAEQRRYRRARNELQYLDDRMLKDIGLARSEIDRVVRHGRHF